MLTRPLKTRLSSLDPAALRCVVHDDREGRNNDRKVLTCKLANCCNRTCQSRVMPESMGAGRRGLICCTCVARRLGLLFGSSCPLSSQDVCIASWDCDGEGPRAWELMSSSQQSKKVWWHRHAQGACMLRKSQDGRGLQDSTGNCLDCDLRLKIIGDSDRSGEHCCRPVRNHVYK